MDKRIQYALGGFGLAILIHVYKQKNQDRADKLGRLSAQFDQEDRDFRGIEDQRDAFRKRIKGQNLTSEDLRAGFDNINKDSDF